TLSLHDALPIFGSAEEVAATDDDRDLRAVADDGRDLPRDGVHHVGVHAQAAAPGERLSGQLQQKPAVHFAVVALLSLGGHRGSRLFRCTYEEGHCRWGVVRIPCGNGLLVRSAVVRHARVRDGVTVRLLPTLSGSCARRGTDSDADLDAR